MTAAEVTPAPGPVTPGGTTASRSSQAVLTIPQQGVETSTATEAAPPAADQTAQFTLPAGSKRSIS